MATVVSDFQNGPGYVKCKVFTDEKLPDDVLFRACDLYYTPHLGGIIKKYGPNIFEVTVYKD